MKTRLIATLSAAAFLAGCATVELPPPATDSEAAKMLSGSIERADNLSKSTASADAKAKPAVMEGQAMTINYAGEARDLLRQVAATRGKTFHVRGPQPYLPLFVIVDVKGVSFEEFLTEVGMQFGQRATLALTDNTIEVRYRGE